MEEWKDVEGYEGLYQVSNEGRVRSLDREITYNNRWNTTTTYTKKGVVLSPVYDRDGYLYVNLKVGGEQQNKKIHKLIGECFIPNPNNLLEIDHINTIRDDNRIENLRWCTRIENNNNPISVENRLLAHQTECKKTYQYTLDGELVAIYDSVRAAARETNLQYSGIRSCCNGGFYRKGKWVNCNTYKGYRWSYEPL